jgi:DNA-binding NtrC family response regulator
MKILILDDPDYGNVILKTIRESLTQCDVTVNEISNFKQVLSEDKYDVVLIGSASNDLSEISPVIEMLKKRSPNTNTVAMGNYSPIDLSILYRNFGVDASIERPSPPDQIVSLLNYLQKETQTLADLDKSKKLEIQPSFQMKFLDKYRIVGESDATKQLKRDIMKFADRSSRVLITGPNGAGKELVARAIHENSKRSQNPFVEVNCAAIPKDLIESELFGHKKGAFTGAINDNPGKFLSANTGTLFLDEIGDMPPEVQSKLLRVLQEGVVTKVGESTAKSIDVRVISATNKDLPRMVAQGMFREDLYHRIKVIELNVPSLNERRSDIPLLVDKFLNDISKSEGIEPKYIEANALKALENHLWTGNIRELRNSVERLMIMSEGKSITLKDVSEYVLPKYELKAEAVSVNLKSMESVENARLVH